MNVEQLFTYFDSYVPLSAEEKHELSARVKERALKRKEFFLQEGQVCHHYAFVLEGCFKTYSIDNLGKQHNLQFAAENDWLADISSFYADKPSKLYIETLEPSRILLIEKKDLFFSMSSTPSLCATLK